MLKNTLIACVFIFSLAYEPPRPVTIDEIKIIPQPDKIIPGTGSFTFSDKTIISVLNDNQKVILKDFASQFKILEGWEIAIEQNNPKAEIQFIQSDSIVSEGYILESSPDRIIVKASSDAGFFYGIKTLAQLLPVEFVSEQKPEKNVKWTVPSVKISDSPEFGWRGYMLDVSRHFFGVEDVKKVIDFMADNKLNRFHWHLADDQGWRVEIKQYPRLTEIGAWRVDYNITDETISNWWGRPVQKEGEKATYGGFYTQEEIKEIVTYAKDRFIEIIPEIDMPGHAQATIAAYPEIGCVNAEPFVATGGVYHNNTYNPGKEVTFEFAEKMLNEIMDLFPFEYVHIGGDECNKEQWRIDPDAQRRIKEEGFKDEHELQSYFIKRIEKIINARERIMIGWDEILEGGLAPNATVMSWRGENGGIASAKAGHDVVMTPNKYCYIDLKQGHDDFEPNLGYSQLLLSTSYNYQVYPEELTNEERKHIMGIQANMWTESISDWGKLTYMTFPRIYAIAENSWTAEEDQEWSNFIDRLEPQLERLDQKGVRYSRSAFSPWILHKSLGNKIEVYFTTEADVDIFYTLDGTEPTANSLKYDGPFTVEKSTQIKANGFRKGIPKGTVASKYFQVHPGILAEVKYNSPYRENKTGGGDRALIDLQYAMMNPGDSVWQGFADNLDVELSFPNPQMISGIELTALKHTIGGVYIPELVQVYGMKEGDEFQLIGEVNQRDEALIQGRNKETTKVTFDKSSYSKIRVVAKRLDILPPGQHRAGTVPSMLVDEIVVLD